MRFCKVSRDFKWYREIRCTSSLVVFNGSKLYHRGSYEITENLVWTHTSDLAIFQQQGHMWMYDDIGRDIITVTLDWKHCLLKRILEAVMNTVTNNSSFYFNEFIKSNIIERSSVVLQYCYPDKVIANIWWSLELLLFLWMK